MARSHLRTSLLVSQTSLALMLRRNKCRKSSRSCAILIRLLPSGLVFHEGFFSSDRLAAARRSSQGPAQPMPACLFFGVAATEFVELFVGAGAARVRQLFDRARRAAPSIVFIDEIDAISCARGSSHMAGAAQEAEQTLNQLLVSMDGLDARTSRHPTLVIAACNRPEMLDEALLRPGRFDRLVRVDPPDADGRLRILLTHIRLNHMPLASDVDTTALSRLAKRCEGLGGAALEAVVNEAAIRAAWTHQRLGAARRLEATINGAGMSEPPKREVAIEDFEAALDAFMRSFDG